MTAIVALASPFSTSTTGAWSAGSCTVTGLRPAGVSASTDDGRDCVNRRARQEQQSRLAFIGRPWGSEGTDPGEYTFGPRGRQTGQASLSQSSGLTTMQVLARAEGSWPRSTD